jgi:uncharacterized membrane protein
MEHLSQFLGRLHPLMVHLPIGILVVAIVLHFMGHWSRFASWRALLPVLWFAGAVTAVLACLAGLLLKSGGGYEPGAVDAHQYAGLALAAVAIGIVLAQRRLANRRLQDGAVAALALLLGAAGHYGGNLTHGEDFLSQPLYAMVGKQAGAPAHKPIANINEALVYRDLIEPVLKQKCWQCHSAQKKQGDLRLDTKELLLQGGEHGEIVVAGEAGQSDLYKRLILPVGHKDRMPPQGKPQLTAAEVQLIHWWITMGQADFTKKVAQVEKDEQTKLILATLSPGGADDADLAAKKNTEIPTKKVARANPAVLRELESLGVAFTALTPDQVFLAANMVNTPRFTDQHLALLLKLREQLVWLDLSETAITDKSLPLIARLHHLTRLKLDNTQVTDAGIAHLKTLPRLRALNLYGTQVSDQGLKALHGCRNLQVIYLWQTQVTEPGVAALQKALGRQVEINFGSITDNAGNL